MASEQKNVIAELREEIKSTFTEFQKVVDQHEKELKENKSGADTKAIIDALSAKMDNLETKMNRPPVPETATYDGASTKSAFFKYMRKGFAGLTPAEMKTVYPLVEETSNSYGEILVPEELEKEIMRTVPRLNVMRNLCSVKTIKSDRIRTRSLNEVTGGWVKREITGTITESSFLATEAFQYLEDLYGIAKIGEDELMDTDVNLEAFLADSFARFVAQAEDTAFTVGTGHASTQPEGVMVNTSVATVNTKQNASVTADDFLSLVYALEPQYRNGACFIVNSSTELALRMLKDGKGQYLWQPSVQAGKPNTFFGYPIHNQEDIASIPAAGTSAKVAAFGNFKDGYRIIDGMGMTIRRLDELYAESALVGFKMHRRVGGSVIRPASLKTLTVIA